MRWAFKPGLIVGQTFNSLLHGRCEILRLGRTYLDRPIVTYRQLDKPVEPRHYDGVVPGNVDWLVGPEQCAGFIIQTRRSP